MSVPLLLSVTPPKSVLVNAAHGLDYLHLFETRHRHCVNKLKDEILRREIKGGKAPISWVANQFSQCMRIVLFRSETASTPATAWVGDPIKTTRSSSALLHLDLPPLLPPDTFSALYVYNPQRIYQPSVWEEKKEKQIWLFPARQSAM